MIDAQWKRLQTEFLVAAHDRGPFDLSDGTIVIVPSLTLPVDELKDVIGIQYYEERLLFLLLLLSRPGVRLIFISSSEVAAEIIDYYLGFLPDQGSARSRLTLMPLRDTSQAPLTTKILRHQEIIASLQHLLRHTVDAYMLPFNVTPQEEDLAARLGIPIYGAPSGTAYLGGKSGGRVVARSADVPVVDGVEDVSTLKDIHRAFRELCRQDTDRTVLKLNDSFSGMGNAIVSREPSVGAAPIGKGLWALLPEGARSWDDYFHRLQQRRGVMELMLSGTVLAPSAQMLIRPGRSLEVVSTHDQILGGRAGQVYLGCEFPAKEKYRNTIVEYARSIASVLAYQGVIGLFAIDFLVSPHDKVYFGEINLRLGGTTHPFGICRYLTKSKYDAQTGMLISPLGERYYVASDNVQDELLVGKSPATVLKVMNETGLLFDDARLAGVTLHQMGSLSESGKLGICSIALSPEEARRAFQNTLKELTRV
jgi:PGM1 C-terminal domain/ATP-grasp domain